MRLALLILAASFSWLAARAAAGEAAPARKETSMNEKEELFARIEALTKLKALRTDAVSKALKQPLEFKLVSQDEYSRQYRAQARKKGSLVESVELRADPKNEASGLVSFDIASRLKLTVPEIMARYGDEPDVVSPSAHAPKNTPVYFVYAKPGGNLSFGFTPGDMKVLVSVVWDTTPESAQDE